MKLKNVVAVSGHPGLMTLVSSRNNGLILKDPATGKSSFFSVRTHQFTPLETVGIYTMKDTVDLKDIFQTMMDKMADLPPVSVKSSGPELMAYFANILPDYDKDRVYPGDVKKVIKWFNNLNDMGFLTAKEEDEEE
ncbi:MAG: DUF5606 domain-containing protein [Saprospiraceae bacterium]|nr:DUF5606 domain-containing protein [Saprospiraceae bacterium]MBK7786996.1 DUF5606 domain-containing protein [Saprospiraceae bacterium]MBK7790119.1 DUF5606 domain-containing protein [Saprospiraceae bacterium]MBK8110061.1 DUF5606 domain-containing protein [Saprospiraceae bacterium]MBK8850592.1 DUF5606 domain-containing protein [Saprospiraceae bacterium]